MKAVLKNEARSHINQIFRGRKVTFRSKASRIFDISDEEQRAEYFFWLERYGFIRDVTANIKAVNET